MGWSLFGYKFATTKKCIKIDENFCWTEFCQTPTRLGTQPERTWTNLNKSGSELTLFSHVTRTRTRTRRTRTTSPDFTLQEGSIGLYLREGEKVGVWKVSGRYLEGVSKVSGRCLEGVWKVSGSCLEGVWEVSGRCKFFETQIFSENNFFQSIQIFLET